MIGGGDRLELALRSPIGDRQSAALTGADGTIDWWAPSGVDRPATFFALVDSDHGAALSVSIDPGISTPPAPGVQRWATDWAPVVETVLTGTESSVRIRDVISGGVLFRDIVVLRGPVDLALDVRPGHAFGSARRSSILSDGISFGPTSVRGFSVDGSVTLDSGDRVLITISANGRDERVRFEEFDRTIAGLDQSWKGLLETSYDGRFRLLVRAALRQLLLLTNATSGGLVRALTTSLPARTDHERQIDSRLCWLDDGARFVRMCEQLERYDLADPTRDWLAAAVDDPSQGAARLISGEAVQRVTDLSLPGWRHHGPVVSGHRGAMVVDHAALSAASLVLDARRHRGAIVRSARYLHMHADQPDAGRWGSLGSLQRHVSSAVAARKALEAAAATERRFDPLSEEAAEWTTTTRRLGEWLSTDGCFGIQNRAGWRRASGDDSSDAQLLRWIIDVSGRPGRLHVDYPELRDDNEGEGRRRSEIAVDQTLAQLDDAGLLHRHLPHVDDGFAPGQSCDLAASFEMVSSLAALGRWDEASERMERALGVGSASGTFCLPTFADAQSGCHRGDRPAAPALLAFVEAAIALDSGPR